MLPSGSGQARVVRSVDQDLAALRPHRRAEPEQRRQRGVAETGGEHDFRRADRLAAGLDPEVAGRGLGLA